MEDKFFSEGAEAAFEKCRDALAASDAESARSAIKELSDDIIGQIHKNIRNESLVGKIETAEEAVAKELKSLVKELVATTGKPFSISLDASPTDEGVRVRTTQRESLVVKDLEYKNFPGPFPPIHHSFRCALSIKEPPGLSPFPELLQSMLKEKLSAAFVEEGQRLRAEMLGKTKHGSSSPRAGQSWTENESNMVKNAVNKTATEMAIKAGRTKRAILLRIQKTACPQLLNSLGLDDENEFL